MNIAPNYRIKRHYNTAKSPLRQCKFLTWLIWFLSKNTMFGREYTVTKVNMEGLEAPYLLLSNHMYFIDFKICATATWPNRVNNVVNIDGYYMRPWLMEWIGAICTRKFTSDIHLVKAMNKCLKRGDVVCMYPEARYSPCGITSYLPDSLGKLIKLLKVPVVTMIHHGNHLDSPFWNWRKKRKVPLHAVMTQILTVDQIKSMTAEQINEKLREAFEYDEYRYQKGNGILITEDYRAEGLHKILYQCPHCMTESRMDSEGTEIFCRECGKRWNLNEDGTLSALEADTEFSHVPDWFNWERQQVKAQIDEGIYSFEDEVEVYSFPRCYRFIPLGKGKITHDPENGFRLDGQFRGKAYHIQRKPLENNGLHVEYDHNYIKPLDCFEISTENDSFYCYPTKQNVITKLSFATEEIYQRARNQKKERVTQ